MIRPRSIAALAWPLVLMGAGCDNKKGEGAAASASSLAPSIGVPSAGVAKYAIDAKGVTTIDMPAPNEHIKAETTVAGGNLDVDPKNLANTRGEVKVDMTSLKTRTFGNDQDATQTGHALTWLEVSDKTPTEIEKNRWAIFAIRAIDGLSASDLTKVAATKEGSDDIRAVTLTAHGDFLLHGHKVAKDAELEARFHYPAGAAADSKPTSVDVKSKTPLHIVLGDHEVKPRDTFGKIAQGSFSLLGTKVAQTADVSLDLHAVPGS